MADNDNDLMESIKQLAKTRQASGGDLGIDPGPQFDFTPKDWHTSYPELPDVDINLNEHLSPEQIQRMSQEIVARRINPDILADENARNIVGAGPQAYDFGGSNKDLPPDIRPGAIAGALDDLVNWLSRNMHRFETGNAFDFGSSFITPSGKGGRLLPYVTDPKVDRGPWRGPPAYDYLESKDI